MEASGSTPGRDALIEAILTFLADQDLLTRRDVRTALEREIDDAGPETLVALKARLVEDNGWSYYPPDPLARRVHHLLADRFLDDGSELRGSHHLAQVAAAPVLVVSNHLSYSDANVIEILLHLAGGVELANRLTAMAGPTLGPRAVASAARQSIDVALGRLRGGDALVLFGEGTRSRSGGMQPMLPAAARYLDVPGAWVLPLGLTGSESLFPVDLSSPRPARVVARLGVPIEAAALVGRAAGDKRLVMDTLGLAIAETLPEPYRGVYGDAGRFPGVQAVLHELRG
jgi:1-acyl-sn-glycerol-3-phosphate acyltransferase